MNIQQRPWISRFCKQRGNEYFCKIDREFIEDADNWAGIENHVINFADGMDLILDENENDHNHNYFDADIKESAAKWIYGLLHAKFILTERGMEKMIIKYQHKDFGRCPRAFCDNQRMLPIGLSDIPCVAMVKLYCPKCMDIFYPKSLIHHYTDGVFFGTKFPGRLLQEHPELRPRPYGTQLIKTLYGYRIHSLVSNDPQ